jgi:glucose/arabinose dehydrogenase/chitodextrinase
MGLLRIKTPKSSEFLNSWDQNRIVFLGVLLVVAGLLSYSSLVSSAAVFVQQNYATPQSPQSSVSVTYNSGQTLGNTNVLVIGWNDATSNITSVTDSAGNAYQVAVPTFRGSGLSQAIYYAPNIRSAAAGGNTVTVTFNQAAAYVDLRIAEYSGLATTSPFDVGTSATGASGGTANSGSVNTSASDELLVGAGMTAGVFTGAGTNFTQRVITSPDADILEDRSVSAIGGYSATAPTSGAWVMQIAAFKTIGAAPDTTPPTVSVTSPLNGAVVLSTISVSATASDNAGVVGVQFLLDGVNLGAEDTTSPFSVSWNTTTASNAGHLLTARARDAAGNSATSSSISVTVDNQAPTGTILINNGAAATNNRNVTLNLSATDTQGAVTQMRFSNTGTSFNAAVAYAGTAAWTLTTGAGTKTVYAQFQDAVGNWSASFSDTIVLDTTAPTISNRAVSNVTGSSATVTWTTNEVATSQADYGLTTSYGATTTLDATLVTSHSVTISGLSPSTLYHYRIRTKDAAGNETVSSDGTFTTTATPDTTPPSVPTNLSATSISSTQINLTWTASTDNVAVTGYKVFRDGVQVATVTTPSFSNTGLTPSTPYTYAVSAFDAAGNVSALSASASATTPAPPDTTPPSAPTGVSVTPIFETRIDLAWNASTDNVAVTGYRVFRDGLQIATSTLTSFSNTGLSAGTTYAYTVRAFDAAGNVSSPSATTTATTLDVTAPSTPTNLTADPVSQSQINLTWTASTDNVAVTGYNVFRDGIQITITTTNSFADSGLTANTTYSYAVRAFDAANNYSAFSTSVNATTPSVDATPPTVSITTPTAGSTVSGTVAVTADATDNVGVAGVQFLIDGVNLGAEDTGFPYSVSWNTTTAGNGPHTIAARARDAAGNITTSSISMTVSNSQTPGLIAGYAFDEGAGTIATDASSNNLTGVLTNGPTWTTGRYGSAVAFDGSNDYVNLGNPTALQITGSITINAWIYSTTFPFDDAAIVSKRGSNGFQLDTTIDRGPRGIGFKLTSSSGSNMMRYGATAMQTNTWYHVAGVYNATTRTMHVYLNGILDDGALVGTVTASQQNSSLNVNIGKRAGQAGYEFAGPIDDVRIYNRALTQAEIQTDMNTALGVTIAPDPPVLATPANGATGVATNPTLTWNPSTGATSYRLQVSSDAGFTTLVADQSNITTTSVAVSGLGGSTQYYWHVLATNSAGTSAYSTAWSLTTAVPPLPPAPPVLATPLNGAIGVATNPTLTWSASTGATSYRLQVSTSSAFTTTVVDQSGITATSLAVSGLATNTHYYWRVNATNTGGTSTYSTAWSFTTAVLPAGLVAAYAFDEGVGTQVADASGTGNIGTTANTTWTSAAKFGNALEFNGTNARVVINDSPSLHLTSGMTLEAWVYPFVIPPTNCTIPNCPWMDVLVKDTDRYYIEASSNVNHLPEAGGVFTGGKHVVFAPSILAVNTWTHLALTYDGAMIRLYVNGLMVASAPETHPLTTSTNPLFIGGDQTYGQYFNGRIDEVRVYNVPLTQAQIQADMNTALGGATPPDPTPPTVIIDSPTTGAQVSDIITVTADAFDNVGVAGVQFYVDGLPTGAEDTTDPFGFNWDTRTSANGSHTLTALARDAAGNTTLSAPVTANVNNTNPFQNEILATGFNLPTAIKFLPDGRLLVVELAGTIKILPPPYTTPDPTPFLQLTNVGSAGVQQGVYEITLDPNFSSNHYYYIFYTLGTPNHDRLSRFTANATLDGTLAGSEFVLYEDPQNANAEHHGGAINFGNDGKIYFTTGEHFNAGDAQLLTSPRGKLHRINPDGTIPTDNPFYDGAGPNWDSIWALGLRNPYRAYLDAPTNKLYIGDVGGNDYSTAVEELDVGIRGANYGWPDCELGTCGNPNYTAAIYAYPHLGRDSAITGGFVYHGSQYPASYQGSYFFADYTQNWIRRLTFDAQGNVNGVFNFEPPDGSVDGPYGDIVYLTEGPDGAVYYVDLGYSDISGQFGVSKIRRIRYTQSNLPPTAISSANLVQGPVPLTVNFSSAGSTDPEGQPLTYQWTFGDSATSTAANPVHTDTQAGQYSARLTVSDGVNNTIGSPIAISVGNPPTLTISSPTDGALFIAGDVISFSGVVTDLEDGTLPASAFTWNIDFLHEGHVHPGTPIAGVKSGTFTIPTSGHDFSGFTRYRVRPPR